MITPKPDGTIRILMKNPNGIVKTQDRMTYNEWKEMGDSALTNGYSIIGLSETNYAFTTNRTHNLLQHLKRQHRQAIISTSKSAEPTTTEYQPGGTVTIVLGPLANRIQDKGQDTTQMGRWSYVTIRRSHQPSITIITAYRTPKATTAGDYTAHSQQMRQLRIAGYDQPNPRVQCIKDLTAQIQAFQQQHHSIILLIDANEPHTSSSGIGTLLHTTSLIDIISAKFPGTPATHRRGSNTIDILAISQDLLPAVQRCGYLPFYEPPYAASDHRGGYIDLDMAIILKGTALQTPHNRPRTLQSTQPRIVERYCTHLGKMCLQHNLLQRRDALIAITQWTDEDHIELESLDKEYTALCLLAESKSTFPTDAPWHPRLHLAFKLTTYWRIRYSNQRNNTQATKQQDTILIQIRKAQIATDRIAPNLYPLTLLEQHGQVRHKLRIAYQYLKLTRQEAETERNHYLATEAELSMMDNDHIRSKILQRIRQSEERKNTFRLLKLYIKDNTTSSVQEVQIPSNPTDDPKTTTKWHTVNTQDEVEYHLHQYSKTHFAQATGTPFTIPPFTTLFGYSGLAPGAESILTGDAPDAHISPTMKLILQSLARKAPTMPFTLPTDDELATGFKKWPEKTSTSPSGRHLGHYKALLASPILRPNQQPSEKVPRPVLFHFLADLTRLAIQHCHTFGRWEVIWNILLQKTPGDTRIHRHRFLHLKEADDNLITKKYIAKDLMRHAETHHTIADEAHGGRKGRQALDVAWMKVLLISQIHHEQKPACIFFNDLTSCYDRITENHSNMALRAHGCPIPLLALHAQNQLRAKYYIVSGYGVSDLYNQHTETTPFHGSGQGAGDSPARWTLGSTGAIQAYKTIAQPYHFCSPNGDISPFYLAAFVDDTHNATEMPHNSTIEEMAHIIQTNTSLWEQLMHNIGAKLELSKCTCYVYVWNTDSEGETTPQNSPSITIRVKESATNNELTIHTSKLSDHYKLMGVKHTGDHNQQAEMETLLARSNQYATRFSHSPIYGIYAELSYNCSYLPSIGYSMAVTSLTEQECYKIQTQAINAFLPHMGYNRHFPRALTFLPKHFGGLQLIDLYTLQGKRHLLMIMRHLRNDTAIGQKFLINLASYQQRTGLHNPVLTHLQPTPYTTNSWITSTREFLSHIDGQLHIHQSWTPNPLREHDINIMQAAMVSTNNVTMLHTLNRCRLYLQVTFLSELCTPKGQLIPGAYCEQVNETPLLHQHTNSKLIWPHQPKPGNKSCKQWRAFLNKLRPKLLALGNWKATYSHQRQWTAYHSLSTGHIFTQTIPHSDAYLINPITNTTRRLISFLPGTLTTTTIPSDSTPVVIHNHTSCHPVDILPHPKDPPKPITWTSHLEPWQRQMFQDENTSNISHTSTNIGSSATLHLICASYHQIHGTHHGSITGEHGIPITYGGISPTPLGHSSTNRATLSAIYSGLLLIKTVWTHYQWDMPHQILIRLQDPSITLKVQSLLHHKYKPHPLSPDYDITSLLWSMYDTSQPAITAALLNIQEDPQISNPADMEYLHLQMAHHSKSARKYHHITLQPLTTPPSHAANNVGLTISGTPVPNRIEFKIHCASRSPDFAQYLLDKHTDWTHTTLNNIDWHPHGRALSNLPFNHRVIITKFIHGWLPLNYHMNRCDPNVPTTCPACNQHPETPAHFLQCSHPSRSELRKGFQEDFIKHLKQGKCEPLSQQLLTTGLFTWSHTPPSQPPQELPLPHQQAYDEQQNIGWDQLWQGRLSSKWAEIHELYRESPEHPAREELIADLLHEDLHTIPGRGHFHEIWTQLLIRKIWSFVINTWQLRNTQQHASDEKDPTTTNRLKHQIQAIYQSADQLPHQDREIVQNTLMEDILHRTRTQQQQWVMINQNFIQKQNKAAQTRAISKLQDIRQFFTKATIQPENKTKNQDHTSQSMNATHKPRRMIQGRISFKNSADPSLFQPP